MPKPASPDTRTVTATMLREWPVPPSPRGTVLVVGGARTVPGAVLLTGTAALRAGAGTLQLAASERHSTALGIAVPEASVFGLPETPSGAISKDAHHAVAEVLPDADVVVIGPGLTDADETAALLERLLSLVGKNTSVVLDAFALGALSREPELTKLVSGNLLLTPNVTEAAFLLGRDEEITDYPAAAAEIAGRYRAVVTLMGGIAHPDGRVWVEESGHIGLATSGSGDVLAGLTGGFLSRTPDAAQAVCWATHVHAVAGQRLIPRTGTTGLLARELVEQVPRVIAELSQ
jgi:ADP-dependent NAD(P)H-hydrate dehydratase